ncbi:MAG: Unknown protein [uncultured Sulfurovum sp.]|uniref:Uncharacterized protein n=1 Tax=uncultured Sulfurovum sp. TaxID=269237 RepID=A0A6S6SA43_9BACT|nr:MAG: Unknown protein [uncultured Sulfurovum sp.]
MKALVGYVFQRTIKKHTQIITSLPKGLIYINLLSLSAKFSFYANLVLWCVKNSTLPKYDNMTYYLDRQVKRNIERFIMKRTLCFS